MLYLKLQSREETMSELWVNYKPATGIVWEHLKNMMQFSLIDNQSILLAACREKYLLLETCYSCSTNAPSMHQADFSLHWYLGVGTNLTPFTNSTLRPAVCDTKLHKFPNTGSSVSEQHSWEFLQVFFQPKTVV